MRGSAAAREGVLEEGASALVDGVRLVSATYPSVDGAATIHASIWQPVDPALADGQTADLMTAVERSAKELADSSALARQSSGRSADSASEPLAGAACSFTPRAPSLRPRGIVQIVHGMSEHIGRYDDFARFLARNGFVVCGNDHIGHGRSVACPDDLGHIPLAAGKEALIADVHELRQMVGACYAPDVPYVVFGHSMGSFIAYAYAGRHAAGLAGAVLCGTGRLPAVASRMGNALARIICVVKGERFVSGALHGLGAGAYSKQVDHPRTEFDWLSTDPAVVDAYRGDPLCGAKFTAGGYAALTDLTHEIATSAAARAIPRDLPVLFIAGKEDPVGNRGAGVQRACDLMDRAGARRVSKKLYPGMRHEILNEPGRAQVYRDVLSWLDKTLAVAASHDEGERAAFAPSGADAQRAGMSAATPTEGSGQ